MSRYPSISSDGRYVAFDSSANDLIPGGNPNPQPDVFVRDLQTSTTTRVSVNTTGGDPNADSSLPSVSADGRYVAFYSFASDLVAGDTDQFEDVFVRDRQTGTTTRASVDTAGGNPNNISNDPSISGDGRYVAFHSYASDLVSGDQNSVADIFVRDLATNTTTRASVDALGREVSSGSGGASMADGGRYVAFSSAAAGLVVGDGNGLGDVFVTVVVRPKVASVTPDTVDRGSTITLTVTGSGFLPGAAASASAFSDA